MEVTGTLRVLIVEDDPAHAEAIRLILDHEMPGITVDVVATLDEYRQLVSISRPDIALLDLNLPDGRAVDALNGRADEGAFPILLMTSYGNEATAVEAMKAGALDYLVKSADAFRSMPRTLTRALREWEAMQGRRRAEQALRDSEARFRSLFEAAPLAYQSLDEEGRIIEVNRAWRELLGYPSDEVIGQWFGDLLLPAARDKFLQNFPRFKALGEIRGITHEMVRRDGRPILVEFDGRIGVDAEGHFKQTHCLLRDISEREQMLHALRESEEMHRSLLDHAGVGIGLWDLDGRLLLLNRLGASYLASEPEALVGRTFLELFGAEAGEVFLRRVRVTAENESRTEYEDEVSLPVGTRWFLSMYARVLDGAGKVRGVQIFCHDTTERKQAEQALQESERRFEALTRISPVGVFRADFHGATTLVNPKWCEIAGIPADAARGDGWLQAVHPDDRARVEGGWQGATPDERSLVAEYRFLRPDGSVTWVMGQVAPEIDSSGQLTGYVGSITDITERKYAEDELERGRAELQAVYDHAPVMMCVLDRDRRVLYANRAFQELTGRSGTDIKEDRACGVLGCIYALDDDRGCGFGPRCESCSLRAAIADSFASGEGHRDVEYQSSLVIAGKTRDVTLLAATAMIPSTGEPRLLLCLEDLTERRQAQEARERAEAALRQTQKVEAVGRLAGGVAHDFNNLLQAMMATVQSLRMRSSDPAAVRSAQELEKQVKRGAALTKQLLLFSRREQPKTGPLDLNDLVREAATLLRRLLPENIRFATEFAPGEPQVEGDHGQLDQVLMNLAVNARDAMPEGGRLVVRTGLRGDAQVLVEVEDSGIGMPEDFRERIFDPFFTTKGVGQGTGLGLAVVHGIVSQHGGHVEVESAPGQGSTFRVVLPRVSMPQLPSAATETTAQFAPGRGERILVVEDEAGAREGLAEILDMLGYLPTVVGSAEEALCLSDSPPFDVLLSDLMLPGITGGRLASSLLTRWPALRVILMSGYLEDDRVRHELPTRVRFLQKPFDLETLGHEIRAALDDVGVESSPPAP
ncbi:MAG TPA: PAS domain S-box protein [Thermoanaerobaculaceae bacterium]|nr:PAS domain S-box protein [Thermoanaerobaculaceae bacterium]